jgi:hypothetical protein
MTHYRLEKLLNEKIKSAAYEYLPTKQGSKGSEIKHTELKMSNYLSPTSRELSTDVKCKVFDKRNKMTLKCDIPSTKYENIYTDNVKLIYKVYKGVGKNKGVGKKTWCFKLYNFV